MATTTKDKPKIDPAKMANQMNGEANSVVIESTEISISLPALTCFSGYATRNINFDATRRQAAAAKVLWCSLSEAGERVSGGRSSHPNGKVADGVNDGIRFLLDKLADRIEESTGKDLLKDFGLEFTPS